MKPRKAAVPWLTGAALILVFSLCGNAAETAISSVAANPAQFDGESIVIDGVITNVYETTSHRGNDYSTFDVKGGGAAVKVFIWGHPDILNGDNVEVKGVFTQVKHVGPYTFYDELNARSVTPVTH